MPPSSSTAISVYSHKIQLVTKIAPRSKQSEECSSSAMLPVWQGRSAVLCADRGPALLCSQTVLRAQSSSWQLWHLSLQGLEMCLDPHTCCSLGSLPSNHSRGAAALQALQQGSACITVPAPQHPQGMSESKGQQGMDRIFLQPLASSAPMPAAAGEPPGGAICCQREQTCWQQHAYGKLCPSGFSAPAPGPAVLLGALPAVTLRTITKLVPSAVIILCLSPVETCTSGCVYVFKTFHRTLC